MVIRLNQNEVMNTEELFYSNDLVYFPIRATANFLHQFEIILWIPVQYIRSCMPGTHFPIVSSFTSVFRCYFYPKRDVNFSVRPKYHFTIDFLRMQPCSIFFLGRTNESGLSVACCADCAMFYEDYSRKPR